MTGGTLTADKKQLLRDFCKYCLSNESQELATSYGFNQNKNYNAEQAKMIEGCKVEQNGLYLSMIVSDNAEQITKIYKEGIGV